MITENGKHDFLQFVNQIGYDIGRKTPQNLELEYYKSFSFLPEMALFIASYVVKKSFTRPTKAPAAIRDSICFYFKNVYDGVVPVDGKKRGQDDKPFVRVFPSTHAQKSFFKKDSHVSIISIFVSADYLKGFLRQDAEQFGFLFDSTNNFWIEEIMTDDIIRVINDIFRKEEPGVLKEYHYRLKAMELLFYLFKSLARRDKTIPQKLNGNDIKVIYKVRDRLLSSLQKPATIEELKQIAGMNELKMRKIFTQVFGMGIYDYYQYFRMKEAARLLREEGLSVSEVGYHMGFENLSHFTRVFEKYIGKKPKKYSKELASGR